MKRRLILAAMSAAVGLSYAADIEPGLDWQYKGDYPYTKAIAIWTDEGLEKAKDKAIEAVEAARAALIELLTKPDSDVAWDEVKASIDADRGKAKIVWAEAIPSNKLQRLTHPGYYLFGRQGWGFSILANFDCDGYVTEFALNEIGTTDIESRLIFTDGITVHESALQKYTVPTSTIVNGEPCRTTREIITALEACENEEGLLSDADIILPECRLRQEAILGWICAHTNRYALATIPVEPNGCRRLRAATPPCICHHAIRKTIKDDASTEIGIANAVAGFRYRVLESTSLDTPFVPSPLESKLATADGTLTFEVPIGGAPAKFYRIEVIGDVLPPQ